MGCIFPVVTTAVQNAVPRQMLGTATAAGVMFRQIGGSLAVAVFGAMFARAGSRMCGRGFGSSAGEIGPAMVAHRCPMQRGAERGGWPVVAGAAPDLLDRRAAHGRRGLRLRADARRKCRSSTGWFRGEE